MFDSPTLGSTTLPALRRISVRVPILGKLAEGDVAGGCEAFGGQGGYGEKILGVTWNHSWNP